MSSGGKGGSKGSGLKDYYASFGGIAGWGPADHLVALIVDGKEVWRPETPVARSVSANPYVFDVDGYGRVHFYWGTDAQTLSDPVLPSRDHPPYRRRVLAVFEEFLCGRERTSVPDMKVIYWRTPQQSVITGDAAALDADGQANPMAALAELITNPVTGLGLPASVLDATSWQALADQLYTARATEYLSVELTSPESMRSLFAQVNGYLDTWFRADATGAIEAGRFLQGDSFPTGLPSLSAHDLSTGTLPEIDANGYANADNRLDLRFTNRDRSFEADAARFDGLFNREQTVEDNVAEVQRPWIRRPDQANAKVAEIGSREARPYDRISLRARSEKARDVMPGDLFTFSYDPLVYTQIARILRRIGDRDGGGAIAINAETERGLSPQAFAGSSEALPTEADITIADAAYWHPLQATPELADDATYRLIVLCGQQQGALRGFHAYFQDAAAEYVHLGWQGTFAVPVKLVDAYPDTTDDDDESGDLKIERLTTPAPLGFDDLSTTQTEDEIADDNLLLFIVSAAAPETYEILTVKSIESPTSGEYPIYALRNRFASGKGSWAADDPAYLIYRSQLAFYRHRALSGIAAASGSAALKVAPFTVDDSLALADATGKTLDLIVQVGTAINIDGNAEL